MASTNFDKPLDTEVDALREQIATLENHELGDGVNITAYNTTNNQYVFPSDGYVRVRSGSTLNDAVEITINGFVEVMAKCQAANYTEANSIFVKKGMTCYTDMNTGSRGTVYYRPLVAN